ncbi:hypothetical protein AB5L52_45765 (plasmid) [Streptomyces sp. CG4]|uniref:hypothetical protein n=1 Tax=Streptomyces sp. CG4 TaxID=408783 RepID=UPI0034E23B5A
MYHWTVTIPTIRSTGTEPVHGSQTWVIHANHQQQARELALANASTPDAVRHRRQAAIDATRVEVTPWRSIGSSRWSADLPAICVAMSSPSHPRMVAR